MFLIHLAHGERNIKPVTQWPKDAPDQNAQLWLLFGIEQDCMQQDWEGCPRCQAVYGCTPDLLRLKEEEKGMPGTQRRRWGPHIGGPLQAETLWLREAEFGYDISQETRRIGPSKVQMLPQLCPQKHGFCLSLERDKLFRNMQTSCRRTWGSPKVRKNIH